MWERPSGRDFSIKARAPVAVLSTREGGLRFLLPLKIILFLANYSLLAIIDVRMKILFYQNRSGRSPVEDTIRRLPKSHQARFVDVITGLESYGLGCPRLRFKQLRVKLWEIKFRAFEASYRVAYVIIEGDSMIWLHVFSKKTQKTPIKDLELAEKRMKEVLSS